MLSGFSRNQNLSLFFDVTALKLFRFAPITSPDSDLMFHDDALRDQTLRKGSLTYGPIRSFSSSESKEILEEFIMGILPIRGSNGGVYEYCYEILIEPTYSHIRYLLFY